MDRKTSIYCKNGNVWDAFNFAFLANGLWFAKLDTREIKYKKYIFRIYSYIAKLNVRKILFFSKFLNIRTRKYFHFFSNKFAKKLKWTGKLMDPHLCLLYSIKFSQLQKVAKLDWQEQFLRLQHNMLKQFETPDNDNFYQKIPIVQQFDKCSGWKEYWWIIEFLFRII